MGKIVNLVLILVVLSGCVALAKRPDFSHVPGYAETQARLIEKRSEKKTEGGVKIRDFGSTGFKLDEFGSYIQYQADMKEGVISLDFEESVDDIKCEPDSMTIVQRATGSEHKFVAGEYISASNLWNCSGSEPVYRKITEVLSENSEGKTTVVVVSTEDVHFSELFEYLSASTYHTGSAKQYIKTFKDESKVPDNSDEANYARGNTVVITSPNQYSNFSSGDKVLVKWEYDSGFESVSLKLYSVEKNGNVAETRYHWDCYLSDKQIVAEASCFTVGKRYKFSLEGSDFKVYSEIFAYDKPSTSHSINVYEPEFGETFMSGDTIPIEWEAFHWPSSSDRVNIYLYKDVNGPDSLIASVENVLISSGGYNLVVPERSKVGSGTGYYIYLGYDCGVAWCSEGFYSKKFNINFVPPFTITTDLSDNVINIPSWRTVTWTSTGAVRGTVYVSVKAQYPSILPWPDKTLYTVEADASDGQARVYVPGSTFPCYFEIAYDCLFMGYLCSTVTSKTFGSPQANIKRWNIDDKGKVDKEEISVAELGCDDLCGTTSQSLFCSACDAGIDMSVSATCEECSAQTAGGFYDLQLEFVGTEVESFEVKYYGEALFDISLDVEISAEITKEKILPIFRYPLNAVTMFLGPISFLIDIAITGSVPLELQLKASMQALVETSGFLKLFATARYGQRIKQQDRGVTVYVASTNNFEPKFEFNSFAEAAASAGLRVGVSASFVNVVGLEAYIEGKATMHGRIEKFPAKSTKNLTDQTWYNFGDCTKKHYLEYYLDLSADAHAEAQFNFVSGVPSWSKDYEWPYKPVVISGCLLPDSSKSAFEKSYTKVYTITGLNRDDVDIANDTLVNIGIADEICNITKWPKGSLVAEMVTSGKSITGINFTLHPIASKGAYNSSSEKELEQTLASSLKIANGPKSFYTKSVGKYFKGKFEGIELVTVVSSSSIIFPSFFIFIFALLVTIL